MALNSLRHRARRTPIPDVEHGLSGKTKTTKDRDALVRTRQTLGKARTETEKTTESYFKHVSTPEMLDKTQAESTSQGENETEAEVRINLDVTLIAS
jgi:hypothetical protein